MEEIRLWEQVLSLDINFEFFEGDMTNNISLNKSSLNLAQNSGPPFASVYSSNWCMHFSYNCAEMYHRGFMLVGSLLDDGSLPSMSKRHLGNRSLPWRTCWGLH